MDKITKFGKFLRVIRINTGESAQQMAAKLGMSPSYLSTIENGKRNIPPTMEADILANYKLTEEQKAELRDVIVKSSEMVKIDLTELPENKRHVIFELTRDTTVDDDTVELLREILAKKKGEVK